MYFYLNLLHILFARSQVQRNNYFIFFNTITFSEFRKKFALFFSLRDTAVREIHTFVQFSYKLFQLKFLNILNGGSSILFKHKLVLVCVTLCIPNNLILDKKLVCVLIGNENQIIDIQTVTDHESSIKRAHSLLIAKFLSRKTRFTCESQTHSESQER